MTNIASPYIPRTLHNALASLWAAPSACKHSVLDLTLSITNSDTPPQAIVLAIACKAPPHTAPPALDAVYIIPAWDNKLVLMLRKLNWKGSVHTAKMTNEKVCVLLLPPWGCWWWVFNVHRSVVWLLVLTCTGSDMHASPHWAWCPICDCLPQHTCIKAVPCPPINWGVLLHSVPLSDCPEPGLCQSPPWRVAMMWPQDNCSETRSAA